MTCLKNDHTKLQHILLFAVTQCLHEKQITKNKITPPRYHVGITILPNLWTTWADWVRLLLNKLSEKNLLFVQLKFSNSMLMQKLKLFWFVFHYYYYFLNLGQKQSLHQHKTFLT